MSFVSRLRWSRNALVHAVLLAATARFGVAQSRPVQRPAQGTPPATAPKTTFVTRVEGVTEYRLANGLRVLLIPDSSRTTVTVSSVYFVGSRNEGYGEAGMAHILEHLLFRGTRKYPDLNAEYARHGASRNGNTSVDATGYWETLPAIDSHLEWAVDMNADRMVNALVEKKQLDTEFSVVRNELESYESDPWRSVQARLFRAAYQWHAYGRNAIGTTSDIENVPIDRLQAFYRRYYQPDNALFILSGKFDPAKALALIERKLGAVPRPVRSLERGNLLTVGHTIEPAQDGEQYVTMRRAGDAQMIVLGYHIPGVAHPDFAAIDVLADVLGSNPSGRMYKALVDTREAAALNGDTFYASDPTLMFFRVQLRMDQSLDSVRAKLLRVADSARTSGFSAEDVARARNSLLRNAELLAANSQRLTIELSQWAGVGDWRLFFLNRDRIAKVTPADVQRVAAAYLKPSNSTTVAFIPTPQPDRAEIPPNPDVRGLVSDYKGRAAAQSGEAFVATPQNIEARVVRSTLPGGLRLNLLPKQTRGGKVYANIVLRYGSAESLEGRAQLSTLTSGMLIRGTTSLTRQQLVDSLSKLTAAVGVTGTVNSATLTIETVQPTLLPVLELVAQMLRSPRLDPEELERLKKERLVQLDNVKSNPVSQAQIALFRQMTPKPAGHVQAMQTTDEQIADVTAATIDSVRAFYQSFFGASYADLSVVGDFDAPAVSSAATRLFGDWKSAGPYERPPRAYVPTDSALVTVEIRDKPNAAYYAGTVLPLRDDDPDYPAVLLAHYALAGNPSSRLPARIRGAEGISYGVSSLLTIQSFDRYGTLTVVGILAPQNVERYQVVLRQEIDRAIRDGITPDELEQFRSGLLQSRAQSRTNDVELAALLTLRRNAGRTFAYDDALEADIAALTVAQVNAAIRKYIDPKRIVLARAGDFK